MAFTIWRQGVVLGTTELSMRSPGPATRVGYLDPTDDFERAWPQLGPVVGEFLAAGASIGAVAVAAPSNAIADPVERGRRAYEELSKHPGVARLRAANEAVISLGLELRDSHGNVVPTRMLMIQPIRIPDWISDEIIERHREEARAEGLELPGPRFMVVVWELPDTPLAGLSS